MASNIPSTATPGKDPNHVARVIEDARYLRDEMRFNPRENGYIRIHPGHKTKAYAETAALFKEVAAEPFIKHFLRRIKQPGLFVRSDALDDSLSPAKDYGLDIIQHNMTIGEGAIDLLDRDELRAQMRHEMSHLMRLDSHMKRDAYPHLAQRMGDEHNWIPDIELPHEVLADKLAVFLDGHGGPLERGLRKLNSAMQAALEEQNPGRDAVNGVKERDALEARIALIRETSDRLQTPQGRSEVEKELHAAYLGEHEKLFPEQFARAIENKRTKPVEYSPGR